MMSDLIEKRSECDGVSSLAAYSACERYRYTLTRSWDPDAPHLTWIMLNPSTATELVNDPTIERCERRSRQLEFGSYTILNIFAFRATDPKDLKRASDPIGPDNDQAIQSALAQTSMIVAAWGAHGGHLDRHLTVMDVLRRAEPPVCHIGLTAQGHPRHPLYVSYDVKPQPWAIPDPQGVNHKPKQV